MHQGPQDIRVLSGVMDHDSAPYEIAPQNYREARNTLNRKNDGEDGSHRNIPSFITVPNYFLKGGTNIVIGSTEDIRDQSVIFAVYNSLGYHGWFRYYQNRQPNPYGAIEKLYQVSDPSQYNEYNPNPLNFQEDYLITGINLVDGMLFWTNYHSDPKMMNIDRANETKKKRQFNVYLNRLSFTSPTTYTLNVHKKNVGLVGTITWLDTSTTYIDRAAKLCDVMLQSPIASGLLKAINKVNYSTLEILEPGEYYLDLLDGAARISNVVPENFYPDYIAGFPLSYPAMSQDHTIRIKYPPFKAPSGVFGTTVESEDFNVQLQPVTNSTTGGYWEWMGFLNNSTNGYYDQGGRTTLGASYNTGVTNPVSPTAYPIAYASYPSPAIVPLNYTLNAVITIKSWDTDPAYYFRVYIAYLDPGNNANFVSQLLYDHSAGAGGVGTFNLVYPGLFSVPAGFPVQIITKSNLPFDPAFPGIGGYTLSGSLLGSVLTNDERASEVASQTLLFRSKYQYREYQNSVYSLTSQITITSNPTKDNYIDIDFSDNRLTSPALCSEILSVTLAVSQDGGVTWYDIKTFEPYECVGPGQATYRYNGKETRIAIDAATMLLQSHAVPEKSKSQFFIDDRIWDGGLIEGKTPVDANYNIDISFTPLSSDVIVRQRAQFPFERSFKAWKRGWGGYLGIVYFDDADRPSKVCLCKNARVDVPGYYQEVDNGSGLARTYDPATLTINITNEPPPWAKKYAIVRTRNLEGSNYLMWAADTVRYIKSDGTVGTYTDSAYYEIDVSNIAYYIDKPFIGAKIEYTFTEGDRVRIIDSRNALIGILPKNYDYPIAKVDGTKILVKKVDPIFISFGALLEFYTPERTLEQEELPYYEFGYTFPIKEGVFSGITRRYHVGSEQDQSYGTIPSNIITPAVIKLEQGDVYYRDRLYPINTIAPLPTDILYYISSNYANEQTDSKFSGNGRVESVKILDEISRPSAYRFSNQYYSGTKINGLCANEPANGGQFATDFGLIETMIGVNNDVLRLVFANSKQESIYVNQGIIRQTQGDGNIISQAEEVAGNARLAQRTLGGVNPESMILNDEGDIMGYDENEGAVWRYSGNGLLEISAYGLKTTWKRYADQRIMLNRKKSKAVATYDLYRDLYLITLYPLAPQPEILPFVTIKLPFLDFAPFTAQVSIQPLNKNYYSGPMPGTFAGGNIPSLISVAFAGTPFVVVVNPDGTVTVTAPSLAYSDQYIRIVLTDQFGVTYAYNLPFGGGQAAGLGTPFPGTTLAFSKSSVPQPGWTQYFDFVPEYYGKIRNQLIAFKDGELWLMYAQNTSFNNFFGVQYDSKVKWVLSKDYPKVKLPLALWYRGKGNWGSIMRIRPSDSYPLGMETEMTPAHFSLQEDGYYANVLKNKLDPRYPTTDQAWVNGEDLRGDIVEVELYNSENTPVRLDSVNLPYIFSENS